MTIRGLFAAVDDLLSVEAPAAQSVTKASGSSMPMQW
jgi:hypothetical protein